MHTVCVLALDRVIPFDLGIPARVFNAARGDAGERLYNVVTCTLGGRPVRTSADFMVSADHDETALADADTVVIATQEPQGRLLTDGELEPAVQAALANIRPDARVMSICTGSFILAAAGLLDHLPATTHWAYADTFRRVFPHVQLRPDVLFIDNGRVLTSAGGAAGIDLCLHVIRTDHGTHVANGAARRVVVPPWREGGQAQFIEHPLPIGSVASTSDTREWALGRLREPLRLEQLADHAGMSVRTFTRRFRTEVGLTPGQWLAQQRLDRARQLLETTDLPVESIAREAGFGSAPLLRRQLRLSLGVAPLDYRRTFRAPAPGVSRSSVS